MIENIFGTDGIRNRIGVQPFTLLALSKLGWAIGDWIIEKYGPNTSILIAQDTRISGNWVKMTIQSGLLLHPVELFDMSIASTPMVGHLVANNQFTIGIVISASHNPYEYNGIKLFTHKNIKLLRTEQEDITQRFISNTMPDTINTIGRYTSYAHIRTMYEKDILQKITNLNLTGKKIVIDCAHGATSSGIERFFQPYNPTLILINNHPNGTNINNLCGATHPKTLRQAIRDHQADIGFAFDGDGDRIIAINAHGDIKDGDDILALLSNYQPYAHLTHIIGTTISNYGLEHHLRQQNKQLVRAPVGDTYVAELMKQKETILGGENSGHIICGDHLMTGDSIFVALRILQAIIQQDNWHMTTFKKTPQVFTNIPITEKKDLLSSPVSDIIESYKRQLPHGRVLVRYSGTEPMVRVMVEDVETAHAHVISTQLSKQLRELLR